MLTVHTVPHTDRLYTHRSNLHTHTYTTQNTNTHQHSSALHSQFSSIHTGYLHTQRSVVHTVTCTKADKLCIRKGQLYSRVSCTIHIYTCIYQLTKVSAVHRCQHTSTTVTSSALVTPASNTVTALLTEIYVQLTHRDQLYIYLS
jgi:hypothetical protein